MCGRRSSRPPRMLNRPAGNDNARPEPGISSAANRGGEARAPSVRLRNFLDDFRRRLILAGQGEVGDRHDTDQLA